MIEKGLFRLIQTDANVATLVTTTNGTGVYWILLPKGAAVPCIILSRVATDDTYAMSGTMKFRGALFQVDCYAASFYQSSELADIVRHLLESFRGTLAEFRAYRLPKTGRCPTRKVARALCIGNWLKFVCGTKIASCLYCEGRPRISRCLSPSWHESFGAPQCCIVQRLRGLSSPNVPQLLPMILQTFRVYLR